MCKPCKPIFDILRCFPVFNRSLQCILRIRAEVSWEPTPFDLSHNGGMKHPGSNPSSSMLSRPHVTEMIGSSQEETYLLNCLFDDWNKGIHILGNSKTRLRTFPSSFAWKITPIRALTNARIHGNHRKLRSNLHMLSGDCKNKLAISVVNQRNLEYLLLLTAHVQIDAVTWCTARCNLQSNSQLNVTVMWDTTHSPIPRLLSGENVTEDVLPEVNANQPAKHFQFVPDMCLHGCHVRKPILDSGAVPTIVCIAPGHHGSIFQNGSKSSVCATNLLNVLELFLDSGAVPTIVCIAGGHHSSVCQDRSKSSSCATNLLNIGLGDASAIVRITPCLDVSI